MSTEYKEEMTLEESFESLEELIARLGDPQITLEESFALYESGMKMIASCHEKLDMVQKKMQILTEQGVIEEFD